MFIGDGEYSRVARVYTGAARGTSRRTETQSRQPRCPYTQATVILKGPFTQMGRQHSAVHRQVLRLVVWMEENIKLLNLLLNRLTQRTRAKEPSPLTSECQSGGGDMTDTMASKGMYDHLQPPEMCIWTYQEFECGSQTLLQVDDRLRSLERLPCETAEKQTSLFVRPSAYLCRKCYVIECLDLSSGVSRFTKVQDEKCFKHNVSNLQECYNMPEASYWSDSSSCEAESPYSADSTETQKDADSEQDASSDGYSHSCAKSLLEISQPMPLCPGIHAQTLAWHQGELGWANVNRVKAQDTLSYTRKDSECLKPEICRPHPRILHLIVNRATTRANIRRSMQEGDIYGLGCFISLAILEQKRVRSTLPKGNRKRSATV
jgi:hypothetical protein